MYAVLVLAAVLLSLAPMHAQTLLATSPACLPTRFAAEPAIELARTRPSASVPTPRPQAIPAAILNERAQTPAPRPTRLAALPQASPLDHAPNAP